MAGILNSLQALLLKIIKNPELLYNRFGTDSQVVSVYQLLSSLDQNERDALIRNILDDNELLDKFSTIYWEVRRETDSNAIDPYFKAIAILLLRWFILV